MASNGVASHGDIVAEFASRGLIHDSTDRAELTARSTTSQISAYVGFDPTSDSLHVGNLLGQISLRRLQLLGHRPVVLAGGATGMVGDPSGRSDERNLLDAETLNHNVQSIKRQLERILDFTPGHTQAILVDNAEWTARCDSGFPHRADFVRHCDQMDRQPCPLPRQPTRPGDVPTTANA